MEEHRFTVSRSARFVTLGSPGEAVRQVWLVCHGYGQLAGDFVRPFDGLDDGTRWIVAPEGLSRFYVDHATRQVGASWMTSEDRSAEIEDYLEYLDRLHEHVFDSVDRDSVTVHALGFSQGAATVCRWAAMGRAEVDRLILWGGLVPPDLDLAQHAARLRAARPVLVVGEEDEFVLDEAVEASRGRLEEAGIPCQIRTFPGGHRLDRATLVALAEMR